MNRKKQAGLWTDKYILFASGCEKNWASLALSVEFDESAKSLEILKAELAKNISENGDNFSMNIYYLFTLKTEIILCSA